MNIHINMNMNMNIKMQFIFIFPYAKTRLTFRRDSQKRGKYYLCPCVLFAWYQDFLPSLSLTLSLSLVTNWMTFFLYICRGHKNWQLIADVSAAKIFIKYNCSRALMGGSGGGLQGVATTITSHQEKNVDIYIYIYMNRERSLGLTYVVVCQPFEVGALGFVWTIWPNRNLIKGQQRGWENWLPINAFLMIRTISILTPFSFYRNTKLSASTISSALNSHGYGSNGYANGNATPTPAPVSRSWLMRLLTVNTQTHTHTLSHTHTQMQKNLMTPKLSTWSCPRFCFCF